MKPSTEDYLKITINSLKRSIFAMFKVKAKRAGTCNPKLIKTTEPGRTIRTIINFYYNKLSSLFITGEYSVR